MKIELLDIVAIMYAVLMATSIKQGNYYMIPIAVILYAKYFKVRFN